jgi:hypothetical protein
MGVITYCSFCYKELSKEEVEYSKKYPCSIFRCKIEKLRKKRKHGNR